MPFHAPYSNPKLKNDNYTYNYNVPKSIKNILTSGAKNLTQSITKVEGNALTFKNNEGVVFRPLYDIHRVRYVIYWDLK